MRTPPTHPKEVKEVRFARKCLYCKMPTRVFFIRRKEKVEFSGLNCKSEESVVYFLRYGNG